MSSDGVYSSIKGNYKENDNLRPYNYYGWTKLQGEKAVKKLKDYIIIRTRFFDKKKIKFNLLYDKNKSLQKKIKLEQLRKEIY